jgi:hypothetical protein
MGSAAELAPIQPTEAALGPLNSKQLQSRLAVIQDVMRNVMVKDVDYGVIPGTPKPTLFKPGAEKLCVTFKLAAGDPQIVDVPDVLDDEIRYRVRVPIMANGTIVAVGVGECSTSEEKYKWRRPVHINEFNNAPLDRKREKYQRNGDVWQQVRVEPSDVANTVLKMAHKRAYVHAVIMATAAGSIFTQDIEDRPEGLGDAHEERRSAPEPQTREQAQTSNGNGHSNGGGSGGTISDPQDKRLFAIRKGTKISDHDLKAWLQQRYPYTGGETSRILRTDYDLIVDTVRAGVLPQ